MMKFLIAHTYALFWIFVGLCTLFFYLRHKKRIRAFLLGSMTGLMSLVLLHLFGEGIGFAPTLCTTNLLLSTILGIPGTALAVLGELFIKG